MVGLRAVRRVARSEASVKVRVADALVVRAAIDGAADGELLTVYVKGEEHGRETAPAVETGESVRRTTGTGFAHRVAARVRDGGGYVPLLPASW